MISVLRVRNLEVAWAGWFWLEISPEVADKVLAGAAGSWWLARAGEPASGAHACGCWQKLSALHWLLARTTVPCHLVLPKACLCTSGHSRWLPSMSRQRVSAPDRDRTKETPLYHSGLRHRSYTHQFRHSQWIRSESLSTACTQGEGIWLHLLERGILNSLWASL